MKILLDENIPVQLRDCLTHHDVASVNDKVVEWKSIKNGILLDRMEGRFDLLITRTAIFTVRQNLVRDYMSLFYFSMWKLYGFGKQV